MRYSIFVAMNRLLARIGDVGYNYFLWENGIDDVGRK